MVALLLLILSSGAGVGAAELPAQNPRPPQPRIALVLSGGGALGLAHIGVLLWLEEHRIPIRYLAGTSMGGVIAGLYATGLEPEAIRRLAESTDWDEMLRSDIPFRDLPLRRKQDRRDTHNALEIGLRGGLNVPSGLTAAPLIDLFLSRLTLPYSDAPAFDTFPIPFRGVAADLVAGTTVVFRDGPLSEALRATMTVPGVFTPVRQPRQLLVDGELTNPLPTDLARAMGADSVVAVVITAPIDDMSFGSPMSVLQRAIDVATFDTERRNIAQADRIVRLEVKGHSFTDLQAVAALVRIGYEEADKQAATFAPLAVGDDEWQAYLAERRARQRQPIQSPSFVDVDGIATADRDYAERRLRTHVGQPLRLDRWDRDLARIVGSGPYERVRYQQAERDGQRGLRAVFVRKEHGPPFLLPGVEIDASELQNTRFNVKTRFVTLSAAEGPQWRADMSLGFRNSLAATYYRPFAGLFVAPRVFVDRQRQFRYADGIRTGEFRITDVGASIDAGREFGASGELRAGYELRRQTAAPHDPDDAPLEANGMVHLVRVAAAFNNQDDPLLPNDGVRVEAAGEWFIDVPGRRDGLPRAALEWSAYASPGGRHAWFAAGSAGTTFGRSAPFAQQFTRGGPLRLGAYRLDGFRGDDMLYGAAGYLRELAHGAALPVPGLLGPLKAGAWYEVGHIAGVAGHDTRHGVTGGLLAKTRLGAFFVGGSWGEAGSRRAYFTLGRFF